MSEVLSPLQNLGLLLGVFPSVGGEDLGAFLATFKRILLLRISGFLSFHSL